MLNHRLYLKIFLIITLCLIQNICHAENSSENIMVWFDSDGLYHNSDILEYLNDVHAGKIKDSEIKDAISAVVSLNKTVTSRDIKAIAKKLDSISQTAAIYYPDINFLNKRRIELVRLFKKPSKPTGTLKFKFYGIQTQGNISLIPGSSNSFTVIAIPADPVILSNAVLEFTDEQIPILEKKLAEASETREWQAFSRQLIPSSTGIIELVNLHQGPWIIYQNLYGVLACCYRIQITPEKNQELVADKCLWKAGLRKKRKK